MSRYTEYERGNKELKPIAAYWAYRTVPLEEALKPFFNEIDGLERSIQEAKKHCKYSSAHGITRDESAALLLYTMEGGDYSFYRRVNEALRKVDRRVLTSWFPYLKLFDSMLSKMPTVRGNFWRGVQGDVAKDYTVGEIITWWGISSCSTSVDVVQKFLSTDVESTLFMIEAINGKSLGDYTMFPDEKEVILGIGTKLRVKDIGCHFNNLSIVHLEEFDSDFGKGKRISIENKI